MRSLLVLALAVGCITGVLSAERPERGQVKGMELYSWEESGTWVYVLLDGTNRLKSENEVKKSPNRIATVNALAARFEELAGGEHVMWNFHFVPGFSFPEEKIFSEIVGAAKSAQIRLIPDKT
jgi:hypothetical protein